MGLARWLDFVPLGRSASGLTDRWAVHAKQGGALLGEVKYWAPWRRYAFFPVLDTLFEADCLRDLAGFLDEQTKGQRERAAGRRAS